MRYLTRALHENTDMTSGIFLAGESDLDMLIFTYKDDSDEDCTFTLRDYLMNRFSGLHNIIGLVINPDNDFTGYKLFKVYFFIYNAYELEILKHIRLTGSVTNIFYSDNKEHNEIAKALQKSKLKHGNIDLLYDIVNYVPIVEGFKKKYTTTNNIYMDNQLNFVEHLALAVTDGVGDFTLPSSSGDLDYSFRYNKDTGLLSVYTLQHNKEDNYFLVKLYDYKVDLPATLKLLITKYRVLR